MLGQDLHATRRRNRSHTPIAAGAGAWGEIVEHDAGEVLVDLDNDAARVWGPVPYLLFAGSSGTPAPGDRVFLHLDTDGEPAYAVVQR